MALIHSVRWASLQAITYNVLKSSVLYTTYNGAGSHPTIFVNKTTITILRVVTSWEKFAFVECEFHDTNSFECECESDHTL